MPDATTATTDPSRPRLALSIPNLAEPAELVDLGVRAELLDLAGTGVT